MKCSGEEEEDDAETVILDEQTGREVEILSCLDVEFDPMWGNVISFHPFALDLQSDFGQPASEENVIAEPLAEGNCAGVLLDAFREKHPETEYQSYVPSKFNYKRLRSIHEFCREEMVSSPEELELVNKRGMNECICFLHLQDCSFGGFFPQELLRSLNSLSNLEVVILNRIGLRTLKGFDVQTALYLDISENHLHDIEEAINLFDNSKVLQYADFWGNPFVSLIPNSEERLLASAPWSLHTLNRKPVEISRKVDAICQNKRVYNSPSLSQDVWDYQICKNKMFAKMNLFLPEMIRHLDLSCTGIAVFHLGLLTALESLNLSSNRLSSMKGGGIEQLKKLRVLRMSRNHIYDPIQLLPLAHLCTLNWLELSPQHGANDLTDNKHYRLGIILLTIDSKGSQTKPGLNFLDMASSRSQHHNEIYEWMAVSTQERLDALNTFLTGQFPENLANDVWSNFWRCFMDVKSEILRDKSAHNDIEHILRKEFYRCKLVSLIGSRRMIKAILMKLIKQNPIEILNGKPLSIRDRVSVYFHEQDSEDYQSLFWRRAYKVNVDAVRQCYRQTEMSLSFDIEGQSQHVHPRLSQIVYRHQSCAMKGCVLPADVKVGLRYEPSRVEDLGDTHSWGLVSDCLKLVLPQFTGVDDVH
eukprot:756749-Hanusia_phi.AAC.11